MMKLKICLPLLLLFILLSSCNAQKGSAMISPSDHTVNPMETNNGLSNIEESDTSVIAASPITIPYGNDTVSQDYSRAYYDVIAGLINQYGFYVDNENWGDMGLIRTDLIDFEGDGIPELVCIYRNQYFHNITIYRYVDHKAELLVDELTGNSIFGDNWSDIEFTEIDGKPYILTQNCDWGKVEKIKIFTVDNGALEITNLSANVQVVENGGPHVEHYVNCQIDGKSVAEKEYIAQKEYYYRDGEKQDYNSWSCIKENGDYRVYEKEDAVKFIKSLAADAGIDETEVNALLKEGS